VWGLLLSPSRWSLSRVFDAGLCNIEPDNNYDHTDDDLNDINAIIETELNNNADTNAKGNDDDLRKTKSNDRVRKCRKKQKDKKIKMKSRMIELEKDNQRLQGDIESFRAQLSLLATIMNAHRLSQPGLNWLDPDQYLLGQI